MRRAPGFPVAWQARVGGRGGGEPAFQAPQVGNRLPFPFLLLYPLSSPFLPSPLFSPPYSLLLLTPPGRVN
jgi:hypothetical protein